MKRLPVFLCLLILIPSVAFANTWWNEWRSDYAEDRYEASDYDEGYDVGYEDGYYDGTHFPFDGEKDVPGAFAEWFLLEEWSEQELYAWKAVFDAMFDGIDRTGLPEIPINNPVFVAIATGTKFHATSTCNSLGNAYSIIEMDYVEAYQRGFDACNVCNPDSTELKSFDHDAFRNYLEMYSDMWLDIGWPIYTTLAAGDFYILHNDFITQKDFSPKPNSVEQAICGNDPLSWIWCGFTPAKFDCIVSCDYFGADNPIHSVEIKTNDESFFANMQHGLGDRFNGRAFKLTLEQLGELIDDDNAVLIIKTNEGEHEIEFSIENTPILYIIAVGFYDGYFYSSPYSKYYLQSDIINNIE